MPELVAAVDCGTNSVRLLVCRAHADGRLDEVDRRLYLTRLGQGVDATGAFAPDALARTTDRRPNVAIAPGSGYGYAAGWAEAPQGEVLYGVELADGRIRRCFARSASFHNMVLFHDVWNGDVLTDFAFIEASFGLSYAAVAM